MIPAPRISDSDRYLFRIEREQILIGITRGDSIRAIARTIGRAPSTVLREQRRNRGKFPMYRPTRTTKPVRQHQWYSAVTAHALAEHRRRRPRLSKIARNPRLASEVERLLRNKFSPVQVMQRLRMDFPDDPTMQVSHEAIYRSIFVQGKGELRRELAACLRSGKAARMPRQRGQRHIRSSRGRITDMVMISERPAEVEDRAVPGHWEGDLIVGRAGKSQIGTLVERSTRFVMLLHLPRKRDAWTVSEQMILRMRDLPERLRLSVTWDQGKELALHQRVTAGVGLRDGVFFCDPHSPWQRGTNENTNGLLRQYFPKGTALSRYSQADLDAVADEMNQRPRQTLGWQTPAEALEALLSDSSPLSGVATTT
uniref:IS30 family transposase n=1 Tax=Leucobacter musarum TaxID=1930747 RepID=UPI0012E20F6D|nr:IS30 family transposase [Leucobacter musarum]